MLEKNIIEMPPVFDLDNSLEFCKYLGNLNNLKKAKKYIYDYKYLKKVEPFGMLLISSKIREFIEENDSSKYFNINFKEETNGKTYAANMGYFKSVFEDYGKEPGEAPGNKNYKPITKINIKDSRIKAFNDGLDISDYIAKELSRVISRENNHIDRVLVFAIREIIRNVYDHSESEYLYYSAQYWPSKDLVEIALIDEGKGIYNTLSRIPKMRENTEEEILKLSIYPGITSNLSKKSRYNDLSTNEGFGLYMTSKICSQFGTFVLCSNNKCLILKEDQEPIIKDTSFKGTGIRLQLKVSCIEKISELIPKFSQEGQKIANKLKGLERISLDAISNIY